jgi:anti-sigma regulatory factor (Ser/Thr protein kinase)
MVDDFRLQARTDPRFLRCIRTLVRGWIETCGFEAEAADDMVLAIDEACTNAIRHSYGGRCDQFLELLLRETDEYIEVRLCDQGKPCPPEHQERRALKAPSPDELQPGGLGVQLMHHAFDDVAFCPDRTEGNCVTMRRVKKP